jgi:hypothetical protein
MGQPEKPVKPKKGKKEVTTDGQPEKPVKS